MSLYALTFQNLKDEAEHAIGGTPDTRTSTDRVVNGAIDFFCTRHPWSWRESITTLNTAAGVGQILLPSDFGELIDLVGYQLKMSALRKAHIRTIMRLRVFGLTGDTSFMFALGMQTPINAQTVPLRTIELGPLPASTTANAFYLTYRRQLPVLATGNDVPAIPVGLHEVLRWCVRGYSRLTTTGDGGADLAMFERMLPEYVAADTIAGGPRTGVMNDQVTGLGDDDAIYRLAPHSQVNMPGDP